MVTSNNAHTEFDKVLYEHRLTTSNKAYAPLSQDDQSISQHPDTLYNGKSTQIGTVMTLFTNVVVT